MIYLYIWLYLVSNVLQSNIAHGRYRLLVYINWLRRDIGFILSSNHLCDLKQRIKLEVNPSTVFISSGSELFDTRTTFSPTLSDIEAL